MPRAPVSAAAAWTRPTDVKAHVLRLWERGRILSARLTGEPLFPLALPLRRPDTTELADRFDEVRRWIRELDDSSLTARGTGYSITWTEINHRQLGRNQIPTGLVIPTEADALALIEKRRAAERFDALATRALALSPTLRPWLARRAMAVLDSEAAWDRLLAVAAWLAERPRPGIYLRQLDVPGVDTKFVEAHRGLLAELLDTLLPPDAIDSAATGARGFDRRYGLLSKPTLLRLRALDPALYIGGLDDLAAPPAALGRLCLPIERVFITENEINGLAFPPVPGAVVIFGLGYAVDRLDDLPWLRGTPIHYWGDLDTHGFAILDRLRSHLPHASSFLMDRATLDAHSPFWGEESERHLGPLTRLTPDEQRVFDDLRLDRLGPRVRLEQERIGFGWLVEALGQMGLAGPT